MKKVTWKIVGEFDRKERSDIEERSFLDRGYHPKANGRSFSNIICPFCHCSNKAYRWSYIAVGKRCENCGALMGWTGKAYQFKELTK